MKIKYLALAILFSAVEANADNSTLDAAIGGGIGGALGGAVGVAVNTDKHSHESAPPKAVHYEYAPPRGAHPQGYHCPPGQRKKGRC